MCGYTAVTHPIGMRGRNFQVFMGFLNLRLCRGTTLCTIGLCVGFTGPVGAETCYPPTVPYDPAAQREFADLIRHDFETYIEDVQEYFRCLDTERRRAFEEARKVSEEYGQFLQEMSQ